ncbi:hypothetical protein [Thioalkalivibrio paradoxus]|uniref:Uncharacterized protein n=1 Tax=Thioalkalivibrio paradoxus ARh 1 TaxID=713585 RepID=W0DJ76_9GAMM|nr:hypothetical protein [Thioalkalivibrio paradoxus]AHE96935.1 hypothetical protein THITH_00080 [Thioalkalivibrio paradoxus ARh 1]
MTEERTRAEGLKTSERIAWVGFMLFFVVVLAIYVARGIGLERDVADANRELLDAQMKLAQYTQYEVPRPAEVGLTNAQIQAMQRRGIARPELQLARSLLEQPELIPHAPVLGGQMHFVPDGIHVLNDRWVLATFEDGHIRGQMLLEYEVAHGNVMWQVIESYLE